MAKMSTVAKKENYTTVEVAGHEVRLSNPDKLFFPKPRFTQARPCRVLRRRGGGGGEPAARAAGDDEALRRRRRRRVLLPEAGAEGRAGLAADRDLHLPERPNARRELVANDAAHLVWAVNLGGRRLQPSSGAPGRPRQSGRAPGRPRPDARGALEHGPQGGDVRQGRPRGARPGRLSRRPPALAASTSTCGSSRAGTTSRSAARRWRWRARSSGGCRRTPPASGGRRSAHGVFVDYNQNARDRTIASGYSVRPVPDARVCCPLEWDEVPDVEPGRAAAPTPCRTGFAKTADPAADIDEHAGSPRPAARARAPRRGGRPRRRALAAPLRQAARRAQAGAAVPC